MEEAVLFSVKDGIAVITLNRPQSLNSLNEALVDGVHQALDKIESDSTIKSVVLTGSGKAFCAGGDLPFLESLKEEKNKIAFISKVGRIAKRLTSLPKPVIAMVNGVAAGAGVNLMLACDIIYAVDTAKFAQSFVKVGLIPDCGGLYFLPKAVGIHKAKELMFTADLIDAQTAEKIMLVNHLCSAENLETTVMTMAGRLAVSAPLAISLTKKYLNDSMLTLDDVLTMEATIVPKCMATKDSAEGIKAFKEKRAPKFTGQ